jgi:hypothetical protein
MDYSAMMADMANPQAAENAQATAESRARIEESQEHSKQAEAKKNAAIKEAVDAIFSFKTALTLGGSAVVATAIGLKKFSDAVIESRHALGERVGGPIQSSMALLDAHTLLLDMKTARGISGSTGQLALMAEANRRIWQPVDQTKATAENVLGTVGQEIWALIGMGLSKTLDKAGVTGFFKEWERGLNMIFPPSNTGTQAIDHLARGAAWTVAQRKRRPLPRVK